MEAYRDPAPDQPSDIVEARLGGVPLEALITEVAEIHRLASVEAYRLINVGFEDCNIELATAAGRLVLKVFAPDRAALADRTVTVVSEAIGRGVRHPAVLRGPEGDLGSAHDGSAKYLLMEAVDGAPLYELDRAPTESELSDLTGQLAALHQSTLEPEPLLDPWSIPNLPTLFAQVRDHLNARDLDAVERAFAELDAVPATLLPSLIHGDVTLGNVLLGSDRRVYLIDFASAGRWPRVQELAVIAANLMFRSELPLADRMELIVSTYRRHATVTDAELRAQRAYARAAASMELLGAVFEREVKGNHGDEVALVYEIGRSALHGNRR